MRILTVALSLWLVPNCSFADLSCDELWFARNAMMDKAGYCFGSPLGKALFDNSDCTTTDPQLESAAQAMVQQITKNEAALSCVVDTQRKTLEDGAIGYIRQRIELDVQPPVPGLWHAEESCMGYGADVPVYAAPDQGARVIETMRQGGDIHFERMVLLRDQTNEVVSQLLVDREGDVLPGLVENVPTGTYWTFVQIYQPGAEGDPTQGWVFLPSKPEFYQLCSGVAG